MTGAPVGVEPLDARRDRATWLAHFGAHALAALFLALILTQWVVPFPVGYAVVALLLVAAGVLSVRASQGRWGFGHRIYWVAAAIAIAASLWLYPIPRTPLFMTASLVAAAGRALAPTSGTRRSSWLVLAVTCAPVAATRSPPLALGYVVAAIIADRTIARARAVEPRLSRAVAAFGWCWLWSGLSFYWGPRPGLTAGILSQPGVRLALPEAESKRLGRSLVRWLAESCDGTYFVAASGSDVWISPRPATGFRRVDATSTGEALVTHPVDSVMRDCERGRVVLVNERPVPGLLFLEGSSPPRVRLARLDIDGSPRHGWLGEGGTFWVLATDSSRDPRWPPLGLFHVNDRGETLAVVNVPRPLRCLIRSGDRSLVLSEQNAVAWPGELTAADVDAVPMLGDDQVNACSYLPERQTLVAPGFQQNGIWWRDGRDASGSWLRLGRGFRTLYNVLQPARVLALNYFDGRLVVIDPEDRRVTREIHVGPRARTVRFSTDLSRAYVVSAAGAFELDLTALR